MEERTRMPAFSPTSNLRPEDDFDLPTLPTTDLRPESDFEFEALMAHAEEWRPLAMESPLWAKRREEKVGAPFVM